MREKYSVDKDYLMERKERVWLALENDLYKSGILKCSKTTSFTPEQSALFKRFVDSIASYDAYRSYLDKLFTKKSKDTSDFIHILSQYAMTSEFCKNSDETDADLLGGLSFNGFKPYSRPEVKNGLDSDVALFVDEFSKKFYDAISALKKTIPRKDLLTIAKNLSFQYMNKYKHTLKDELLNNRFNYHMQQIEGKPIEIDTITLDGIVEINGKDAVQKIPKRKFSEVVGNDLAKQILKDLGYKLLFYDINEGNPANPARTVLLLGEPGGGKTMMIQALYNFIKDNAPDKTKINYEEISPTIMSKWAGEAENRMKEVFLRAQDKNKLTLVAIEDIDMLLYNRDDGASSGGVKDSLMSTLMNLLEGVGSNYKGNYLVISTTNKDHHLDEALRKRISNIQVYVPGPISTKDYSQLIELLNRQKLGKSYDSVVDISKEEFEGLAALLASNNVADDTSNNNFSDDIISDASLSGRDIRNIIYAAKEKATRLIDDDCDDILDKNLKSILSKDYDTKCRFLTSKYGKIDAQTIKEEIKNYILESRKLKDNAYAKKIDEGIERLKQNDKIRQEFIKDKINS